ncbi:MAG: hypothetical protein WA902_01550, partial [Thermosynechococcaceae cyanobacterium]
MPLAQYIKKLIRQLFFAALEGFIKNIFRQFSCFGDLLFCMLAYSANSQCAVATYRGKIFLT